MKLANKSLPPGQPQAVSRVHQKVIQRMNDAKYRIIQDLPSSRENYTVLDNGADRGYVNNGYTVIKYHGKMLDHEGNMRDVVDAFTTIKVPVPIAKNLKTSARKVVAVLGVANQTEW